MRRLEAFFLGLAVISLPACGDESRGVVVIDGSSTMEGLVRAALREAKGKDLPFVALGVSGTSAGRDKLCAGEVDLALASSPYGDQDQKSEGDPCRDYEGGQLLGGIELETILCPGMDSVCALRIPVADDHIAIVMDRDALGGLPQGSPFRSPGEDETAYREYYSTAMLREAYCTASSNGDPVGVELALKLPELRELWEPVSTDRSPLRTWEQLVARSCLGGVDSASSSGDGPVKQALSGSTPITLVGPGQQSGTRTSFRSKIDPEGSAEAAFEAISIQSEDDNVIAMEVASRPTAMGYFGFSHLLEHNSGLMVMGIRGDQGVHWPGDTDYELGRPLFIYLPLGGLCKTTVEEYMKYGAGRVLSEIISSLGDNNIRLGYIKKEVVSASTLESSLSDLCGGSTR